MAEANHVVIGDLVLEGPPFFLIGEDGNLLTTKNLDDGNTAVLAFQTKDKAAAFAEEAARDGKPCNPRQHSSYAETERYLSDYAVQFSIVCFDYRTADEKRKSISSVIAKLREHRKTQMAERGLGLGED
jgi:hypothetical protein